MRRGLYGLSGHPEVVGRSAAGWKNVRKNLSARFAVIKAFRLLQIFSEPFSILQTCLEPVNKLLTTHSVAQYVAGPLGRLFAASCIEELSEDTTTIRVDHYPESNSDL